jgi:hemerythrin-like domain-containing protein
MYARATSRMLDDEHRENLVLLGALERTVLDVRPGGCPDDGFAALARTLARGIAGEVERHFRFEEEALFPRLDDGGEGDLAALLAEEHAAIRATAADLLPLLHAAAGGTLGADGFARLKPLALEFVERLGAHIHKETLALLPVLESLLDDETDQLLAFDYAAA